MYLENVPREQYVIIGECSTWNILFLLPFTIEITGCQCYNYKVIDIKKEG